MRWARPLMAAAAFVSAVAVSVLGIVGALDDLGAVGELLQDGLWGAVAALLMLAIFLVGVWPQVHDSLLGGEALRVRDSANALRNAKLLVNGHECSGAWLLTSSAGDRFMSGVDSYGDFPAIPEIDSSMAQRSGRGDWVAIKDLFYEHGLLTVTPLAPVGNHAREVWRLTAPAATSVRNELRRKGVDEPRNIYSSAAPVDG